MAGFVKKCPCLRPQIEEDVRELDYRHCSLTDVPADVFNFERTLEELFVDSNQIRDLPRELFYCHGIRKLSISDNEITNIPPAIASLINLEELDLSKNGIIDMPDNIKCCKYLRSIDASVNPLGKLPEGFTQLLNLTQLYLNDTFLDYLPGNFGRLSKLKILEIRENHLKTLPKSFARLTDLERLDIGHNEFTELPDVVGNLTGLLELWCDHNQIATITPTIGNLKQLMFLDGCTNCLQSLPSEIEGCSSLADLHLTTNRLQSVPETIGNLENLTTLKIDNNHLTSLPSTIGGLSSLSELNVSCNDLEDLPTSLGLLRNLRTFYSDENFLVIIPAELGSCNGITVLSLRSNRLEYIPDEIGRIPRLRVLNLSDNRLKYLPFTIIKLKELQALWLSENQTQPLVPLQSDHDPETGRKILTCYLLPQQPQQDKDDNGGDTDSFHASIWDEERSRRQQIHFAFNEGEEDDEGKLVRCPTPYPKEMKEKIRHARNLAMRQRLSGPMDGHWNDGTENQGFEGETSEMSNVGKSDGSDVRMREARITKPSSPSLQETHRLFRFDKEKLAKDKARMQNRYSASDQEIQEVSGSQRSGRRDTRGSNSPTPSDKRGDSPKKSKEKNSKKQRETEDDGGFPSAQRPTSLGSMSEISKQASNNQATPSPKGTSGFAYCSPQELAKSISHYGKQGQFQNSPAYRQQQSMRSRRTREYDSDTGYRSESEVVKFRQQQVLGQSKDHRRRGYESDKDGFTPRKEKTRDVGYSSDIEGYSGRTREAAYRAIPPPITVQHNTNSLPYDLNLQGQNHTPQLSGNRRVIMRNDELYDQQIKARDKPREYVPPSPEVIHRSKIVDQSTPVSDPPHSFVFSRSRSSSASGSQEEHEKQNSDWKKDFYNAMQQKMISAQTSQQKSNPDQSENSGAERPPPYKPTPPYLAGQGQRKLPPTPSRNSPYGVYNYDRRSSNSPIMYQRISELTINEQNDSGSGGGGRRESPQNQRSSQDQPRQSPYMGSDYKNYQNDRPSNYGNSDINRTNVSSSDTYTYSGHSSGVARTPVSNSSANYSQMMYSGDSNRAAYGSSDHYRQSNYSNDLSKTPVSHIAGERSRTPASVTGGEDDRRDSPRESGYSSREHSSHRNSPCDTSQRPYFDQSSGLFSDPGDVRNPTMSTYEDVAMFKNNLSEPLSQVSSSTDSGYGPHFDKLESPSKYSGYSMPPSQRVPPSPPIGRDQFSTSFNTPRRNGGAPRSRETTPDHTKEMQQYMPSGQRYDKGIFVTKVQEDGPAAMSLRPGDKLLEVNGQDFSNINHSEAVSVMKNTKTVSLYIERV